jgi:hypothetical protein
LTPLLIFNGIGANLELVFPFVAALDPDLKSSLSTCPVSVALRRRIDRIAFRAWPN